MIVDDHAAFRQVVLMGLKTLEAESTECADGQEAVAQYPQFRPEIVLMDIAMKGLDGLDATAQIKARFPDAQIFILTQHDDPGLREAALQAGACRYLLKDDLSQLWALLRSPPPVPEAGS